MMTSISVNQKKMTLCGSNKTSCIDNSDLKI